MTAPVRTCTRAQLRDVIDRHFDFCLRSHRDPSGLDEITDAIFEALPSPSPSGGEPLDARMLARAMKAVLPWDDDPWITDQATAIAAEHARLVAARAALPAEGTE